VPPSAISIGNRPVAVIVRESALFAPRERAALAWTQVLTKLPANGVPDDLWQRPLPRQGRTGAADQKLEGALHDRALDTVP
jgi:alkylhydroperoxidase family enzyme